MNEPTLLSIQTGRPRTHGGKDPWTTSIFKDPVAGARRLGSLGLDGDEQADLVVHGGPDKAVCVYAARHFASWREELGLEMTPGAFGENFTALGQDDFDVAIGDVFEVGEALVEVSQPRGPCWKLARRWGRPDLVKHVLKTRRTGWYLRVLREGLVAAGDRLVRVDRRAPEWTVARVVELAYLSREGVATADLAALASLPSLARDARISLARRFRLNYH